MNRPRHIISRYSQWLAVLSLVLFNVVGTLAQAQSSRWTPTIIATGDCASGYSVTVYDTACDSYMWKGGTEYESSPAGGITRTFITDDDCDSTVTLYLKMNHTSQIPRTAEACDSFVWTSDSTIKVNPQTTGSHTYTMVIGVNEDGCDLAEMLTLNLKSSTSRTLSEVNECDTFIWRAAGQTFTTTNLNAFYTGLNAQGCNDTVRRRIIIRHSTEAPVQNETHCLQYTWPWNSTTYKLSQPTEDLTLTEKATIPNSNAVGCDSTRTLHLVLHHADTLYTDKNTCDNFFWDYNNQNYTETKRDTFSIFNSYGCDSTMILNLIIRYSSTETLSETKVENDLPVTQVGQQFDHEVTNAPYTIQNHAGCDSTLYYTLNIIWNKADTIDSTVCRNEHLPFSWHTYSYTTYPDDTLIMLRHTMPGAAVGGADSAVSLRLHINPSYDNNLTLEECEPYSYTFKGTTYNTPGTYTDVDNNHTTKNCDSITRFSLIINANTTSTVHDTIVIPGLPYDFHDLHFSELDVMGTGSTPRTTVIENAKGCDSTITYHLFVHQNSIHTADSTICENSLPLTWNGKTFTTQGTQYASLKAAFKAHGVFADSIVTMVLHVDTNSHSAYDTTVLENDLGSFSFHGYTPTGEVTNHPITITNAKGCDSIISYTVNVRWNKRTNIDTFICSNLFPYTWRGEEFTGIQNKEITLSASDGTDSVIVLRMHAFRAYDYTVDSAVCQGTTVVWGSNSFTTTTQHTDSLHTMDHNCDSVVRLNLFVDTASHATYSNTIVQNQLPWSFFGQTFTSAVTNYTITGQRATKPYCDSIVTYTLSIHENVSATADSTICFDKLPLQWNGVTFSADDLNAAPSNTESPSGTIVRNATLPATSGADSLLTMNLHVNPTFMTRDTMNSCLDDADAPITWRHTTINAPHPSGNYSLDTFTINGCDSLFRLRLELRGNTSGTVTESIVENELPYTYHDWTFTTFVTDSVLHIRNIYNCDSTVTYTLKVRMNVFADAYDTVCFSQLPYTWNGKRFFATSLDDEEHRTGDIIQQIKLTASTGADSTLTMHLHVNPTFDTLFNDTICDDEAYTFNGNEYTFAPTTDRSWRHNDTLTSVKGCDSVSSIRLRVYPTYKITYYDTITSPELPYFFGPHKCDKIGTYQYGTISSQGCDSVTTLKLWVIQLTFFDTAVCQNKVPFRWHTIRFDKTKVDTLKLVGMHGEDSLIIMDVTVLDTSAYYDRRHECDVYTWQNGFTYTDTTNEPFVVKTNYLGCDSVVHLDLTMHYSVSKADHIIACNSHTWINGVTYEATIYGPQKMLHTVWGCDSLVTLDLYVSYSTYDEFLDSMCLGGHYNFRGRTITRAGTYVDSLLTVEHCDSITVLHLAELPSPLIEFFTTYNCDENLYTINVETDVDYIQWSSLPVDSSLLGQELNRTVYINPPSEVSYTIYADYLETPRCPSTATFSLAPLKRPKAELKSSPRFLTYENPTFEAFDIGEDYDYRTWYIDGYMQNDKSRNFKDDCNYDNDSVVIMLEVTSGYCKDSAFATIMIHKPTLFVPTVFTPYLSTNKVFKPQGVGILDYEISIFNRKGQLVYTSHDIEQGWDGKFDKTFCEQGSYVYVIRYRDSAKPDSYQEKSGTVLLLR